ncbi:MAG: iron ABC transporter permease [Planctomycetia bacterium]|nr:iron ABC transporter permease [Planctomycetia bacterium]
MRVLLLFALLFVAIFLLAPFWGTETLSPAIFWSQESLEWKIFLNYRLPRVLLGLLAGGCLAVCGMVFQAVFRNPLATPFTLGTASGAAFGVSLAILCGTIPLLPAAFFGALLSLALVFAIAKSSGRCGGTEMLLSGIAVSFVFSSLIMLTQYLSDPTQTVRMLRWTMGGLDRGGLETVLKLLPWVLPALGILWGMSRELDLFCIGEEVASARGMNVARSRWILLLTTSFLVGTIVSVCGPIGFIGLMIPHIGRILAGASHRLLFLISFLGGGALLGLCDTFSRTLIAPDEIPVGILTALLGGPFFIGLLILSSRVTMGEK